MPRALPLSLLLLAAVLPALAAAKEQFPGQGRKWRHLQSPNFELYSGASERVSRDMLHNLELLRATFLETFRLQERRPLPVTIFYFDDEDDFMAYRKGGKPRSFYAARPDRATIMVSPKEELLSIQRTIFHEYVHHLMRVTEEAPPTWYNEGMAELFSTLEEQKDHLLLGRAKPELVARLQQAKAMPLEELFAVTNSSAVYRNGEHNTGIFYAQSWALVHFCNFGISKVPKERLDTFLRLARSAKLAAEPEKLRQLTQELLGMDFPQLNEELARYMRGGRYNVYRLPKPVIAARESYEARLMPAEEITLRLAELKARLLGSPDARFVLLEAAERNPRDIRVLETLGLAALSDGDERTMEERWHQAIEAGTTNPAIYHELGQREGRRWFARFDPYFRLQDEPAARLRRLLLASIAAAPHQTAAYETLAWVEATANDISIANANLVQGQLPKLKERARTLLALAMIRDRSNDLATARQMLAALGESEPDAWTARGAEVLLAKIEGRKPAPLAPSGAGQRKGLPVPVPKIRLPAAPTPPN
ncbi:MAG: hypothetical protein QG602_2106 [Verrucomicrobiota bacterium]|nr:hypothetical protein [Verrucomicrobiota bacterium]